MVKVLSLTLADILDRHPLPIDAQYLGNTRGGRVVHEHKIHRNMPSQYYFDLKVIEIYQFWTKWHGTKPQGDILMSFKPNSFT